MQKRKITAREVLQDIRAAKSDKTLMEKFNLSAQGLQSLFDKLVRAGVVTQDELDDRVPISERTVDLGLFICPACGNIQGKEFVKCPRCEFSVPGKSEEPPQPATATKPSPRESGTAHKRKPSALLHAPAPIGVDEASADPSLGLIRMTNYCRILSVAAIISYAVATIGLLFILIRSPASTAFELLVGVIALGVPAIAVSITVFVSLRVLTEAVGVFSSLSAAVLRNSSGRGDYTDSRK